MLKKLLVVSLLAACSTAFAEGTMTEQLKASIDPANVRIVYDVYQQGASRNRMVALTNRYTYAQKGMDFYIIRDYPIMKPKETKSKKSGLFGLGIPAKTKKSDNKQNISVTDANPIEMNVSESDVSAFVDSMSKMTYRILFDDNGNLVPRYNSFAGGGIWGALAGAMASYSENQTRQMDIKNNLYDLCIGHEGIVYMLNRGKEKGNRLNIEDAVIEKLEYSSMQILFDQFVMPNGLRDVLFASPSNREIKHIRSYNQIIGNDTFTAEEFSSQPITEQGIPEGKEMLFTFYYKDGTLKYFDNDFTNMGAVRNPRLTGRCINKVIALDRNIDDYVFNSLKHYEIVGEKKKRGEWINE